MSNLLDIKTYSFNAKVAISLFLLAIFLITILFSLIVPKMQEEQYNTIIKEIEQVLSITKEQLIIAGKAIDKQRSLEIALNKTIIEKELIKLKNKIDSKTPLAQVKKQLNKLALRDVFSFTINTDKVKLISENSDIYKQYKIKSFDKWEEHKVKLTTNNHTYTTKYIFYTKKITENIYVTIFCLERNLNKEHFMYEDTLKINMQNSFKITQNLHKGKTYMFWLNLKYANDKAQLYEEDIEKAEKKYTISKMSHVPNIYTGSLSAKQIMQNRNKGYIEHKLNGREALSWIIDIYENGYNGYIYLLVKTIYKEDLINNQDSAFLKILPAALISLILALIIGFFLFKRLFKSINILTNTAKEVNKGNRKIRSCVKGNDDIGYLGVAFDSMLDSFETNIKNLDLKVEEKTKELKTSLEEKEILLKEIHHRVKNNLALTISFIKLQQEEIKEQKAQKTLIDIQERIYTMELLHRKLYESPNLNQINFKEYVQNLLINISKSYAYEVETIIKIDNIFLSIEKAMPCGLILNEIITNAFKYAFNGNKNPILEISMSYEKNRYFLRIKDNGEGIKKDIDIYNSNTLGLKLINSISKFQLKGELKYTYENGSVFNLTF